MYVVVIHRVVKKENGSNRNCKMQTTSSFPVEMSSKSGEREIGQISQNMGSRFGSCLLP